MKKQELCKILKFLLVGILNTLIGNGTMLLLYNFLHASYWTATATGYILGGTVSYFLNKFFTFKNFDTSPWQLLYFILSLIICYAVSFSVAYLLGTLLLHYFEKNIRDNISMLLGMGIYTILNYIAQRYIVFNKDGGSKKL